jgi:hypothetical protein
MNSYYGVLLLVLLLWLLAVQIRMWTMCEMPSCYGHEERKARKAHICCECNGTIQTGETYHYHHGVWDGEASDYKVCSDCEALRVECDRAARYDECTPFEGLHDAVEGIGNPKLFTHFVEIKRRRGATVPQWMATLADTANTKD